MAKGISSFLAVLFIVLLVKIELASAQDGNGGGAPGDGFPKLKYLHMHAWFMWVSMGFLFPLGIILIRYSRAQRDPTSATSPTRVQSLFYAHIVVQVLAVICATTGIAIMIDVFGSQFQITHARLGLSLLILAMLQPFIGLFRPKKGEAIRPFWYVVHWLFGTTIMVLGFVNVYIGMVLYGFITQKNLRTYYILFGIEVSFLALAYFLQDKVSYIIKQGHRVHPTESKPLGRSPSHPLSRSAVPVHHSPERFANHV